VITGSKLLLALSSARVWIVTVGPGKERDEIGFRFQCLQHPEPVTTNIWTIVVKWPPFQIQACCHENSEHCIEQEKPSVSHLPVHFPAWPTTFTRLGDEKRELYRGNSYNEVQHRKSEGKHGYSWRDMTDFGITLLWSGSRARSSKNRSEGGFSREKSPFYFVRSSVLSSTSDIDHCSKPNPPWLASTVCEYSKRNGALCATRRKDLYNQRERLGLAGGLFEIPLQTRRILYLEPAVQAV
jgi:hypothetical protein